MKKMFSMLAISAFLFSTVSAQTLNEPKKEKVPIGTETVLVQKKDIPSNALVSAILISVPESHNEWHSPMQWDCVTECHCYAVTYYWVGSVPIITSYTETTGCNNACSEGVTVGPCGNSLISLSTSQKLANWLVQHASPGGDGIKTKPGNK